jgi:hypothetical protein
VSREVIVTESDWATSTDPLAMLSLLRHAGPATDRKYRLFACGCCRRVWDRFPDENNRALVAAVEDHPDGTFDDPDIRDAAVASSGREWEFREVPAYWVAKYLGRGFYKMTAAVSAAVVAAKVVCLADEAYCRYADEDLSAAVVNGQFVRPFRLPQPRPARVRAAAGALAAVLRDVSTHPAHPVIFDPSWRTSTVVALARQMYESREFSPMPILADALQDAGAGDEGILAHCREPGVHVRGCHVVDLILSKG